MRPRATAVSTALQVHAAETEVQPSARQPSPKNEMDVSHADRE
jgi:hypothetical protein